MADGPDLSLLRERIREIERRVGGSGGALLPPNDLGVRVDQLEREVADIAAMLARVEPMIARIDAGVSGVATKAEIERLRAQIGAQLADKPSKAYLWALLLLLLLAAIAATRVAGLLG